MTYNFTEFYINVVPKVYDFVCYRPLRLICLDDAGEPYNRQFARKVWEGDCDLMRVSEKTPLQIIFPKNVRSFMRCYKPIEIHMSVARFYEDTFKHFVIDLDTSKSIGISSCFDFARGFIEYIRKNSSIESTRCLYTGNRGFHVHVFLKTRLTPDALQNLFISFQDYHKPFIGKLDMNVIRLGHFIRMPFSFNSKGNKFSFWVDKLSDFNESIAQEKSEQLYRSVAGVPICSPDNSPSRILA